MASVLSFSDHRGRRDSRHGGRNLRGTRSGWLLVVQASANVCGALCLRVAFLRDDVEVHGRGVVKEAVKRRQV